jgi:hypothetical protein
LLFALASGCRASQPRATSSPAVAAPVAKLDDCAIAVAALNAGINEHSARMGGLDERCVLEMAQVADKIQVDARFMETKDRLKTPAQGVCTRARYVIRLDAEHFEPVKSEGVVFLLVLEEKSGERPFRISVSPRDWPKTAPDTYVQSPCGEAPGKVKLSPEGQWVAALDTDVRP